MKTFKPKFQVESTKGRGTNRQRLQLALSFISFGARLNSAVEQTAEHFQLNVMEVVGLSQSVHKLLPWKAQ